MGTKLSDRGLTDAEIRALKAQAERFDVSDAGTPGLTLRVWPTGAKRWSVWYRTNDGRPRRLSLGRVVPIVVNGLLGTLRIAPDDRVDDELMLLERGLDLA